MRDLDYDIAVFAVNEAATIERCLAAIDRAAAGRRARIVVLLNGTTDNSLEIIRAMRLSHAALAVYRFPAADKANAINRFLYDLRLDAAIYFCIDAYTRIGPESLRAMAASLETDPHAQVASSIPINGRSAKTVREYTLKGGAISGQLYALRPDFVNRLVAQGFRLPLQIYRGDPLLGSMAAHDLDALGTKWDDRRIVGVEKATYEISPLSIFRWRDIRRQYRREIRQARGRFENAAIKSIIYAKGYAALPSNATDMIKEWLKSRQLKPRSLREGYFMRQALRHLDEPRPAAAELEPQLLLERPQSAIA